MSGSNAAAVSAAPAPTPAASASPTPSALTTPTTASSAATAAPTTTTVTATAAATGAAGAAAAAAATAANTASATTASASATKVDSATGRTLHAMKVVLGNPAIELVDALLWLYAAPEPPHLHSVDFRDKQQKLSFPPPANPSDASSQQQSQSQQQQCTVCLEAIVPAKKAAITILCFHVFHFHCLSRWADSSCPLCRYMMQPPLTSQCDVCHTTHALWLCLVCGHVGCGRYQRGHAARHFEETGHTFALDVTQQKVWDYVSDDYVHRLVLNKKDGTPVVVEADADAAAAAAARARGAGPAFDGPRAGRGGGPSAAGGIGGGGNTTAMEWAGDAVAQAARANLTALNPFEHYASLKMEQILVEYNYLLSSQLEKQRAYFQHQLRALERDRTDAQTASARALAAATDRNAQLTKRLAALQQRNGDTKARVSSMTAQLTSAQQRTEQLQQLNAKLTSAQAERRSQLEAADTTRAAALEQALKAKDELIQQLSEELHDLQQHVRVSAKIPLALRQQIADGKAVVVGSEATFAPSASAVDPNDHSAKAKLLRRLQEKKDKAKRR